jgi:hypothetical protein
MEPAVTAAALANLFAERAGGLVILRGEAGNLYTKETTWP